MLRKQQQQKDAVKSVGDATGAAGDAKNAISGDTSVDTADSQSIKDTGSQTKSGPDAQASTSGNEKDCFEELE